MEIVLQVQEQGASMNRRTGRSIFTNPLLKRVVRDVTRPLWGNYGTAGSARRHVKKMKTDKYDPLRGNGK